LVRGLPTGLVMFFAARFLHNLLPEGPALLRLALSGLSLAVISVPAVALLWLDGDERRRLLAVSSTLPGLRGRFGPKD